MLKLYFYFLQIDPKNHTFGKSDKSFGEQTKPTNIKYSNLFLAIFRPCQDFLRKLKISQ